jgi:mono/diheme cytochrome c family protein
MKYSLQQKGFVLALFSSFAAIAMAFASARAFQPEEATSSAAGNIKSSSGQSAPTQEGRALFLQNCAHCHGEDARGDEGPDLHGLKKTNKRIAKTIMEGIKGEMPKFGAKFTDADVRALTAFIRSLD